VSLGTYVAIVGGAIAAACVVLIVLLVVWSQHQAPHYWDE
jgi:hypothetical protein